MVERYELISVDGPAIEFDRSLHLPPDEVSEAIGMEAADAVKFFRWANGGPSTPVRVLVPGCGPGTLPHNLLARQDSYDSPFAKGPLHIDSFDINPDAVAMARHNLAKFAGRAAFTHDEFAADWTDSSLWGRLAQDPYDLVLFNPPYLTEDDLKGIRRGYETTPVHAMTGGADGLDHYRTVVPRLVDVLADKPAAEALFRFRTPADIQTPILEYLFSSAFEGKRDYMLRLFPSEGAVFARPGTPRSEQRWLSFGVLCLNPPTEPRPDHPFSPPGRRLDSCMGRSSEILAEAAEKDIRLKPPDKESILQEFATAVTAQREAKQEVDRLAALARASGASWNAIARAAEITAQSAYQRWDPKGQESHRRNARKSRGNS